VAPSCAVPAKVGAAVLAGAAGSTASVAALSAAVAPAALVAVTTTRTVWPTSAGESAYVEPVAPVTSTQPAPSASQRRHW
jgi:hypothetical protein